MILFRCLVPFVIVCLTVTLPSLAQEKTLGRRLAQLVAPLDAKNAIAVGHLDLAKADVPALANWAGQISLSDREDAEAAAKQFQDLSAKVKAAGIREVNVVVFPPRAVLPDALLDVAVVIPVEPTGAKKAAEVIRAFVPGEAYDVQERGDTVIVALPNRLKSLTADAQPSESLATAFDSSKPGAVRIVAQIPNDLKRVIRETFPKLSDDLGGLTGSDIADGIQWVVLSANTPPNLDINLEVKTASGDVAKSVAKLVEGGAKLLTKKAAVDAELSETKAIWEKIAPRIEGTNVVVTIGSKPGDRETLQSAISKLFSASRRGQIRLQHANQLKQLGLAMHNFESPKGRFPARALYDAAGKPLLSWRVQILPYIGREDLYAQFKLDEPWDSEHNKKLIEQMPPEFRSPMVKVDEKGKTPFVVPVSERSIFSGKEGAGLRDITDGTSNTIMVVAADAQHSVVWTKPDDLTIDPKDPTSGLHFNAYDDQKVIYVLMADGAVRGVPRAKLADEILKALTMNGGEIVEL